MDWKNTTTPEGKSEYRKIGEVNDVRQFNAYHVELTYAEELKLWGV